MASARVDPVQDDAMSSVINGSLPIARHSGESGIIARRANRQFSRTQFLRDAGALAARLPPHRHVLNLCADRYHFTVGLAAALGRRQITLLAPSEAPGVLKALAEDHPDLYALTDTVPAPYPSLIFPADLEAGSAAPEILSVPESQPALVLFTSGSTGRPTAVAKSWGTLVRSALSAGERLGISRLPGATIIATVPHQHSYGLESIILLGLQHGLTIDAGRPFYPQDLRTVIAAAPRPRILVTTPLHLRMLMSEPCGWPELDLVLSATAPLSAALAGQAEACFRCRLVEIYGCTEAGQIATRRTLRESDWQCLDGVRLHQDERGTWATGPAVEGKALLHDKIGCTGPATFRLGPRSADLVEVAGKRTSLAHLTHLLLAIDGVEDGVFFVPDPDPRHPRRVSRLTALVVAPGLQSKTILRALRERTDAAFLPRPLICVDNLPRNALGKLPRETLLRLAACSGGG